MIRIGAFLVGLFFSGWLLVSAAMGAFNFVKSPPAPTAEHEFHKKPKDVDFSFNGPLGTYDRAQLQRGLQVFREVCSACHSLHYVSFRDFAALGYNEAQIKTIAQEWPTEAPSINPETGEATTRKPIATDKIPAPYPNEVAARAANNNAAHGGANYVYSLLTGYQNPPAELKKKFPDSMPGKTTHYNPYFANLNLAMPSPLNTDGQVTYGAGAPKPTVDQMAKDVSAFLMWTAEPKLEQRKRAGTAAVIFLLVFFGLCVGAYKNIWADKKAHA
jgi:ubiquinol-cytochrome c reductase cytochrome c1 subunit